MEGKARKKEDEKERRMKGKGEEEERGTNIKRERRVEERVGISNE
jgi:hypothetical protein